jgi:hypothetical protein
MNDDDGDGIWTVTIPLEDGDYEYKFTVNGWSNQEQWPGGDGTLSCPENVDNGEFENRGFTVSGTDMTLETVFWNLCLGETPGTTYDVTFSVNTADIEVGDTGMFVGGGFLGNAQAHAMADDDGDGIWTVTINLSTDVAGGNYIFLNGPNDAGDWGAKEDLSGQECADPTNFNDRIMPEFNSDITLLHCFGDCSGDGTGVCTLSTTEVGINNMIIYPNPVLENRIVTLISPINGDIQVEIFSVTGRKIMDKLISDNKLDVSSLNSGFYLMKSTIDNQTKIFKLIVK